MTNFLIAVLVFFILISGPLAIFALVKLVSRTLGGLKASFVRLENGLGLKVVWDSESYPHQVYRVRVDFYELVRGGRSTTMSYTFEGKGYKTKNFVIPIELEEPQLQMFTDSGLENSKRALNNSYVQIEVETTANETERIKIKKKQIINTLRHGPILKASKDIDVVEKESDKDSLLTRVFPWKAVVEDDSVAKKAAGPKSGGPAAPVDFLVTKVWIEPGCIVCDACENEAPDVFWVKDDTCIVRDNAPLGDAASIVAAAEGCPVDVIKFDTKPK